MVRVRVNVNNILEFQDNTSIFVRVRAQKIREMARQNEIIYILQLYWKMLIKKARNFKWIHLLCQI